MILIADKNGQLGNRLYTFANFIAWGLKHGVRIVNPGFRDYAQYFEGTFADPWCRYPVRPVSAIDMVTRQVTFPIIYFLARNGRKFNIRTPWLATRNSRGDLFPLEAHAEELLASKLTIVRGWQYSDHVNFHKYRAAIRAYFTPRAIHQQHVHEFIARARAGCDVLVGVHIRRGDYAKHLDGRYFYDYAVYRNIMDKVQGLFGAKKVGFLICSNEPVDRSLFNGLNFHLGPNHVVEDMYAFASCDYLIGPPSTYTMWASYYGEVPLFQIMSSSPTLDPKLEEFVIY